MVGKNSKVWEHFDRVTEYMVSCKHCGKSLSSKHTSSNLVRHLYRQHKPIARRYDLEDVKDTKPFGRIIKTDPLEKMAKKRFVSLTDDESNTKDMDFCEAVELDPMYEIQLEEDILTTKTGVQNNVAPGSPESTYRIEKLKAETRYYNEMALLACARRRLVDLHTKRLEVNSEN